MRNCDDCKVEDRPVTTPDGEMHHEVREYLHWIALPELTPQDELPTHWRMKGWKLKRDGEEYFRYKLLCRDCIRKDYEAGKMREAYKKLCKAARGQNDQTYSEMITNYAAD